MKGEVRDFMRSTHEDSDLSVRVNAVSTRIELSGQFCSIMHHPIASMHIPTSYTNTICEGS